GAPVVLCAALVASWRALPPGPGPGPRPRRHASRGELAAVRPRLRLFQFLAGVIPLTAAALLVDAGPETAGYQMFRLLVIALLALSMAGFVLAITASNLLFQTLTVLTANEGLPRNDGRLKLGRRHCP